MGNSIRLRVVIFIFFFGNIFCGVTAQINYFRSVPGLPSKEVFDVFVDKRGFVWVGTELGISRYDGARFLTFTNSLQSSLSCSGITEDPQGRIWFHNFSGQIFYIQNEEMTLLTSYDHTKEHSFPTIAMQQDLLIATSDRGLFVLDTKTMVAKYVQSSNSSLSGTSSLAIFKDKVIAYGNGRWFKYGIDGEMKRITYRGPATDLGKVYSKLCRTTNQDTAYLFSNPGFAVNKLVIANDTIKVVATKYFDNLINTVSISDRHQWVNTVAYSESLLTGKLIKGKNISSIKTDAVGNVWYGSLNDGLWVNLKEAINNKEEILPIDPDDMVRSVTKFGNQLILGTQKGKMLIYEPRAKRVIDKFLFKGDPGAILSVTNIGNGDYVVGTSIGSYLVNFVKRTIAEMPGINTIKQVSVTKEFLFIASASGLVLVPRGDINNIKRLLESGYGKLIRHDPVSNYYFVDKRCRAVSWYPETKTLYVALKDGLYCIDKNGIKPYLHNDKPLFASSLFYAAGKMYIGTINDGLFVQDRNSVQKISENEGLSSRTVLRLKCSGDKLWVMGSGPLQVIDVNTLKFIENYALPSRDEAQVTDVEEINSDIYLSTLSGFFNIPFKHAFEVQRPKVHLFAIKIGGQNIPLKPFPKLSISGNYMQLLLGVPSYTHPKDIYIRYALYKGSDTIRFTAEPGERVIDLVSLEPGSYKFSAIAVDPKLGMSEHPLEFNFVILPPWWQQLWFKVLLFFFIFVLVLYVLLSYTINKITINSAFYAQQQSIRLERQRISSEIHDDIGSGLFAVQLYADMYKGKSPELNHISNMIVEISDKIREVIWTTNIENDNLENLLYYIQYSTEKLFEHSTIRYTSTIPDEIPELNVETQSRRNIYLIVKELAHNAIKHSGATEVNLDINIAAGNLVIVLKDDGVGFDSATLERAGMGLENIRLRVIALKGSFAIENYKGTVAILRIPLAEIALNLLKTKSKLWRLFTFDVHKINL